MKRQVVSISKTDKDDIIRLCCNALVEEGFARFRSENVDMKITENVYCWVGLNTKLAKDYVDVNPFVGVHFVDIEKFWTSMKGGKFKSRYNRGNATYSIHMGKIAATEPIFRFSSKMDVRAETIRLARMYAGIGLGFSRSISNYAEVLPHLLDRSSALGGYPERAASCLYMMRRYGEAVELIQRFLKSYPDYIEGFAIPFFQLPELRRMTGIPVILIPKP
jgi:hypothetical protein